MEFSAQTKLKEIALANPAARQALEDAGLDYCCGGGKSLQEACLTADVSADAILERLRQNSSNTGPEDRNWLAAPLSDLTRHIRDKHHRYVREAIPRAQALLDRVVTRHGKNHPELAGIQRRFGETAQDMLLHMQKEEKILFPYIEELERAASTGAALEAPFFQTVRNPIQMMMKEHDAAGELVRQIRGLSSEYTAPADACTSFRALYDALKQFEEDLHQHVHLENNVLFPRAVEAELGSK